MSFLNAYQSTLSKLTVQFVCISFEILTRSHAVATASVVHVLRGSKLTINLVQLVTKYFLTFLIRDSNALFMPSRFDVAFRKMGVSGRRNWGSLMCTSTKIHLVKNNSMNVNLLRSIASTVKRKSSDNTSKATRMNTVRNVQSAVSTATITSPILMMSSTTTGLCVGSTLFVVQMSVVRFPSVRILTAMLLMSAP